MITEALSSTGNLVKSSTDDSIQKITQLRKKADQEQVDQEESQLVPKTQQDFQPEELLNQIKALTEDGLYAVQFEKDQDMNELVVRIVDTETKELIRQIPAEELMELTNRLQELRGNIIDTVS